MNDQPAAPAMSLADIAGIDLGNVEALRFENLPIMAAHFECKSCQFEQLGNDNTPAITADFEVIGVESTVGHEGAPTDLIGKVQREAWFIKPGEDGMKALGRFKAFLIDANAPTQTGPLQQIMAAFVGVRFPGKIKHRRDKNDVERIYANVAPTVVNSNVAGTAAAAPAPQPAAPAPAPAPAATVAQPAPAQPEQPAPAPTLAIPGT